MTYGMIAGGGELPALVVEYCKVNNIPLYIAALDNTSAVNLSTDTKEIFPVAKAGAIIKYLKSNSVNELIICGSLQRPNWITLIPDAKGLAFISKVILKSLGDDALLKTIRTELEKEGLKICAVQDLIPSLLATHGSLAENKPTEDQEDSIALGWNAAKYHGAQDLGQSVVVQSGNVIALETEKGTDNLLKTAAVNAQKDGSRPILIKRAKPQQDMALDAPTIGIQTIQNLINYGYAGLVIESGRTLVLHADEMKRLCNDNGLFWESRTDEDFYHRG